MLLHNDVVTDGETKPCALARWLRREERLEHLLLHFLRDSCAIVPYIYFNGVPKAPGCGRASRLVITTTGFRLTLRTSVKSIRD
jgi:hypothetical protein